ncbi:putative 1-phosphatidylinositol-4,5-bisphosphate phosphodiesterase 1 [Cercophora newfieldiana]|uniref:Phosphoinositide phospholipase C n=1 Tax=Cercophora newfieldiana TaxID=92897 RepID=A0AA40CUW5_9PEZI|nr:putative 1-phosphatidylinositol-4,5-bisphosphate phosphodiesterase 1 [Cercophora newfieldiana]
MAERSGLSSRMARLNPFKRRAMREEEDEDRGEEIDSDTVAGGGHTAHATDRPRRELQLSDPFKALLAEHGIGDDALGALLEKHHIDVPAHVTDKSHPLPEYFISSSHNTYLMAHQLFGESSAGAYEATLNAGAKCVEIDAWDNDDDPAEPKVTHGFTLVSNIPFRSVCETIRDVMDREEAASPGAAAPILLSLENHCNAAGQLRLVEIMNEVWGERLLVAPVRDDNPEAHVTLGELGSKVVVIVEHHIPDEAEDTSSSSSSSSSEDEDEKQARDDYKEKKKAAPTTVIIPELAALGVYAQSVKPSNSSWFGEGGLLNSPHHPLINVSESGLSSHLPANAAAISRHNARHLMRVYPKGTRISSKNLHPEKYWGVGAQVVALNWQTFGTGMQLNEALFTNTSGFVLKPDALRAGGDGVLLTGNRNKTLRLVVGGAFDVPVPGDRQASDIKPYLTCSLTQPGSTTKRKTATLKDTGDGRGTLSPLWNETLEWKYDETELEFLRLMVKSDDSYSSNPILAVASVRLLYVVPGWILVPMLDLKGHQKAWLLVKFEIEDA